MISYVTDKTCTKCGESKDLDEFYVHPLTRDRRQSRCKRCQNRDSAERYRNTSIETRAKRIATIKARKYGMTLDELRSIIDAHDENCDLCGKPDTTHRKRTWTRQLTLDHDHETGRFRGLLCSPCNLALGNANNDPALLRRMADYIEGVR